MPDALPTYRGRVSRPRKPRNIPFEAEQLLYRFTSGSRNPSKGQSDCFISTAHVWNTPQPSVSYSGPQSRTIENLEPYARWSKPLGSSSSSPAPPPAPATIPNGTPTGIIPQRLSTPTHDSPSVSPSFTHTFNSASPSTRSPNGIPHHSLRDQLRKTATVSNANQNISVNNADQMAPRHQAPRKPIIPQHKHNGSPQRAAASPPRARRNRERDSSSEYESPTGESGSSMPAHDNSPPRRSSRARKEPKTYNVRALVGLELEQTDRARSATASVDHSERSSPNPTNVSSVVAPLTAPQTPQTADTPASCSLKSLGRLLRDRQQGRFKNPAPYKHVYSQKHSEFTPWRRWKGASNDIICLAWSPDGTRFAAGATTHGDEYNRGNNLVLGDLPRNRLRELPDHSIHDPNVSSTRDSRLFTTVSSTQWVGEKLYTASYDKTVKIWDCASDPFCTQTLSHDSQVEVMAVPKYLPGRIATGTRQGFRLWNLEGTPSFENLDIVRSFGQKNVDLSPTNLVWGDSYNTRNLLVGGMAQRSEDDADFHVCRYGHLGLWKLEESSVTTIKLSPDSQNIFDIKWHPTVPIFAAASTIRDPKTALPGSRSLINLYTYKPSNSRAIHSHSFSCPAVDINEVTFCPFGSNHVTASCTDGSTYVWDIRFTGAVMHRLQHGDSIQPIDHEVRREYADTGVRAALWGTSIDQFYTGGSDGYIKQWDIRRATEDTLVTNTAMCEEGVISAALSPDKSHLLVGDNGGGIHVLTSGPCADPEPASFDFEHAPVPDQASEPSEAVGVAAARELLSTGKLKMHPLYGAVQGPGYKGPYARWARNLGPSPALNLEPNALAEKLARTSLRSDVQRRQFHGPALKDRRGLDEHSKLELERSFNLAHACNGWKLRQRPDLHRAEPPSPVFESTTLKRKRQSSFISISSDGDEPQRPIPKQQKTSPRKQGQAPSMVDPKQSDIIDLTLESDNENESTQAGGRESQSILPPAPDAAICKVEEPEVPEPISNGIPVTSLAEEPDEISEDGFEYDLEDDSEDDHWWPENREVDANIPTKIPRGTDG